MKKMLFFLLAAVASCISFAQTVRDAAFEGFTVSFSTPVPHITVDSFTHISIDGYQQRGELGEPSLPVLSRMVELPVGADVTLQVVEAQYDTIPFHLPLFPRQPSPSKRHTKNPPFRWNKEVYREPGFHGSDLVTVQPVGIMRDRRLGKLHFSPVRVNHATHQLLVCRKAVVNVRFSNADPQLTQELYSRYHTPYFDASPALNTLYGTTGAVLSDMAPLRITVLAAQSLKCSAIDDFVAWKRKQGFLVDLVYVPNGTQPDVAAAAVRQIYENEQPAPLSLLLMGDHNQLPAFYSDLPATNVMHDPDVQLDNHVTDLYFSTLTDDILPDLYRGRMSAKDTVQLSNIIDKTIYYEQYGFQDDSYLSRSVLIAGVDNYYFNDYYDNAWRCADPTMDYVASTYINAKNGYTDVTYYKNNTAQVPDGVAVTGSSSSNTVRIKLKNLYTDGVGWINYSGHGDWDRWAIPSFTVDDVMGDTTYYWGTTTINPPMANYDKPSFMIGNCCLSNSFDYSVCFGEALLLRERRSGAVGYIGCTNSSLWDEDFYWSVGVRDNIYNKMNLAYDADHRGAYDYLFHTHGEDFYSSVATAGQMLHAGLMSLQSISGSDSWSTSVCEYYWEIYQLMGDPSLMPWMGQAKDLSSQVTVGLKPNEQQVIVSAPAGSYVAMVHKDSLSLKAAAITGDDGYAYLPLDTVAYDSCLISITAQGYKPCFVAFADAPVKVDNLSVGSPAVWPNPASRCCTVKAIGLQEAVVLNMMGQAVATVAAHADTAVVDLSHLPAGLYLLKTKTSSGTSVQKLVVM